MKAKANSVSAGTAVAVLNPPRISADHKRDAYGFAVRPQHVQRYREYANIYKEEEEERSDRWTDFLERQSDFAQLPINGTSSGNTCEELSDEPIKKEPDSHSQNGIENQMEIKEIPTSTEKKTHQIQVWSEVRSSLRAIEDMMSVRVKRVNKVKSEQDSGMVEHSSTIEEAKPTKGALEEDSEDEFYDMDRSESLDRSDSDSLQDVPLTESITQAALSLESLPPWKEELECLVQGGVPMALRGELWQAFVGAKARRVEKYYQDLLAPETKSVNNIELKSNVSLDNKSSLESRADSVCAEKWKGQIEKDLPRTFPGHPALDEDGRNALRRLLTAYARHNPSVGYCQAMNFFAALLLLLMPEETAFWTLVGILDDYFEGYYSEEMIESQVDQLVLEELVREKFPKLVNHLDYLGVQVAWVAGPWFLSIFMNMLPWESVLRVWDVLLFEGNRVMLFRTALALIDLYGPALVTTKDAGDAVTLLQSLAGSTFDSSQLVLTACMGYQNVTESRLQELRNKHRPSVKAALEERSNGLKVWRDSQGLASKLYGFNQDPASVAGTNKTDQAFNRDSNGNMGPSSANVDGLYESVNKNMETDSGTDLQEQVVWLKVEMCKLLEEKRSAELRAEELETALMEMVKQDNRRQLSAKVEQLEQDIAELRQALADKQEQENAMLQVLMRVEQEQRVTEDARRFAEQDAAAQRYATQVLQEKYEAAMASLSEMERRVVMAESMLEATLQYQSGQNKTQPSPRSAQQDSSHGQSNQDSPQEIPTRKISLLSRWRDRNKEAGEDKPVNEVQSPSKEQQETNGHPVEEKA
ncbi:PREDICTED: rab GTPase-activating protein 1 isoform X3 [Ipomoea nil]|uniref:rab GTPase-activating protein 1 isoform X3 n=1 Tax=Ipomoea nil TaxID=35883 RepID=UPI000901A498|nr:PREDICTED: rab GTPase-activating protein 1 isoform X3 [Ipomoea nil]